ncbi:DNA cytosine methyltransferase [Tessaracoccus sp. MC1865]|nr:DNA cytosine methyltransferase [Tessaracoccus sp. MC1865]
MVESAKILPLRVLDLFAGAGGLSEGFRLASHRFMVVQAVELDLHAAATYQLNHGDVIHRGDIEEWLDSHVVPEVDVVLGGPPCQGFSTLGKRDAQDLRNQLWVQYARTLEKAQPKYFVLENVAVFMKSAELAALEEWTLPGAPLENYVIEARVLNAADYGAHQLRKRAILLGWRRDMPRPGWPVPTHQPSEWRSVRDAFAGLEPAVTRTELPDRSMNSLGNLVPGPFTTAELHITRNYKQVSLDRFQCIPPGGNRFDLPDELKAPCWRKHTSGSGDVMGRLRSARPSVTIRTEFFKPEKGRYIHPTEDRALTHHEAARLQGFPDSYRWAGTKTSIARQIGNAVPIPLGKAIGQVVAEALEAPDRCLCIDA